MDQQQGSQQQGSQQQFGQQQGGQESAENVPPEQLSGVTVVGANGQEIGEVKEVVQQNDITYVIVSAGGVLGLGERDVALPLSNMQFIDGQLLMPNLTEEQVRNMREADRSQFQSASQGGQGQTGQSQGGQAQGGAQQSR